MKNIERMKKISDALQFEALDIVEIFELDDIEISEAEAEVFLLGNKEENVEYEMLESFLNGLIVFFRGESPLKEGQEKRVPTLIEDKRSINNVVLKKMKIALSLSSDELLEMIQSGDVEVSKDKLSSLFRKEKHKSYKYCNDIYVNGFLKSVAERSFT